MGAHPDAFAALTEKLSRARDRQVIDELLDQWFDYRQRATDWDAYGWGFKPDRWMEDERALMDFVDQRPRPRRWPWSRPTHI